MDSMHKLIPFTPPVPRPRSVTFVIAGVLLAAGVPHMFTFGLALDHAPWGEHAPFVALLAASTLVAGIGLVLLSMAFPRRLNFPVDLVTVANTTALGVGAVSVLLGFFARSFPMSPHPYANNAAFVAGLLLSLSGAAAVACRAPRQRPQAQRETLAT